MFDIKVYFNFIKAFHKINFYIMKLSSNTILITGGSSGIGFGLAERFFKAGSNVIITGRDYGKAAGC